MITVIRNQNPPNRSRSNAKRTPKMLSAICELVKKGLSVNHAAQKLHLHHSTITYWRRELPDFDAAILAAEAEFIDSQVANIRAAAEKSWQAAAWLLERKWPAYFAQPQVQFNLPGAKPEFVDFPAMLQKLSQSSPAYLEAEEELNCHGAHTLHGESIIDVPALPVHQAAEQDQYGKD